MKKNILLPDVDYARCTGRTTATALGLLSEALSKQGVTAIGSDHWDQGGPHVQANQLAIAVEGLVSKLGLQAISIARYRDGSIGVTSKIWVDA
jgi:hypothetical protein